MRILVYKITLLLLIVLISFWIALLLVIIPLGLHLFHYVDAVVDASVAEVGQFLVLVILDVLGAVVCLCIAIYLMLLSPFDFVRVLLQFCAFIGL
jgi:hypothetical protein